MKSLRAGAGPSVEFNIASDESLIPESIYQDYLSSLLEGDREVCHNYVHSLIEVRTPARIIYERLFQRSMYEIGDLWEYNRISVSVEHMATSITESLLPLLYPLIFSTPRKGHKCVISCVANEYHQIGGKIVADTLEMNGWDAFFLGANTPVSDMLLMLNEKKPDFVGLSLAVYFSLNSMISCLEQIRACFHDLPILVGGQAFRWGGWETLIQIRDVAYAPDLDSMEKFIDERFKV